MVDVTITSRHDGTRGSLAVRVYEDQLSSLYRGPLRDMLPFVFSSRSRHTSSLCDWSSDVCSSDLRASCTDITLRAGRTNVTLSTGRTDRTLDRKSVRVGKECRSRWSPHH